MTTGASRTAPEYTARTSPDWDELALDRLRRFGGDGLVREMMSLFVAHVPLRLAAARDALAAGDVDALRQAAHALRSSCAQLGAARMAALAMELEEQLDASILERAPALLAELSTQFERFLVWIDDRGAR